ncbi:MAG: RluA family pseudouridine synthase [Alphaproteobacteria bacterium]|nr:RluA family pseudouridine synthase [Alphaproteobacteria bacterium]
MAKTHRIMITAAQAGARLDRALPALMTEAGADISRARLQSLLRQGLVRGPDAKAGGDARVKEGDRYEITVPAATAATPRAQKIALSIVHEDRDLIVINKPAGMVVHPAAGNHEGTLVNALLAHCGASLSGIGGVARPGIVHRLDKDTSGLMVVAKNDAAHRALSAQFADRTLSRTYSALVWGVPAPAKGDIDAPVGRHRINRKKMAVVRGAGSRAALTHYKVLERFADTGALVECRLATGRTHQIRVHMAHIGHPVAGDQLYGRSRRGKAGADAARAALAAFPRQALHAAMLRFVHPRSGRVREYAAPLPPDFAKLLRDLRKAAPPAGGRKKAGKK